LLLAAGAHLGVLVWQSNLHTVLPGRVYRSAQLSATELQQVIRGKNIRTVINLRGKCDLDDWYPDECRVAHDADVAHEDIGFTAGRLPSTSEMRYLVRVLDQAEYPVLIHCRQGADRTGLVAALVLLLYTDSSPADALRQLGVGYGHLRAGHARYMDVFFELYEEWLQQQGTQHTCAEFRRWLESGYCPGYCLAEIEPIDLPRQVRAGQPWLARVRVHNRSIRTWPLRTGKSAGVHLGYQVLNQQGQGLGDGRAGQFEADVPPGQPIELAIPMPALPPGGPYTVLIDMIEEQHCWFFQAGSAPLLWEIEAREPAGSARTGGQSP
jgi:protein tyrosine phosphatase (PTP) superfamily phosphohydrolase (DUF442 family)